MIRGELSRILCTYKISFLLYVMHTLTSPERKQLAKAITNAAFDVYLTMRPTLSKESATQECEAISKLLNKGEMK